MSSLPWGSEATIKGPSPLTRCLGNLCPRKARGSCQVPLYLKNSRQNLVLYPHPLVLKRLWASLSVSEHPGARGGRSCMLESEGTG